MNSVLTLRTGRHHFHSLSLTLLIIVSCVGTPASLASEEGAEQVIQQLSERMQVIFVEEGDRLKSDPTYLYQLANEVLVPHIDFAKVSSLVLGRHWQRATPDQQAAFQEQFQHLLVRTYSTAFTRLEKWEIRFLPSRVSSSGDESAVRTQLLLPQVEPIEVLYQMHVKEGNWMAYDVKVDGISLVTNYRSSFNREVKTIGLDGLIRKITTLNETRVQKKEI